MIATSRVTQQGQVSVPAEIRRRMGVSAGTLLEWHEEQGLVSVRRAGRYTSQDIHDALFGEHPPSPKTLVQIEQGPRLYVKKRHARR